MFKMNIIYCSGIDPCQNADSGTKLLCFKELEGANKNGIGFPSKMASQCEGTDCRQPGQSLGLQVPSVKL